MPYALLLAAALFFTTCQRLDPPKPTEGSLLFQNVHVLSMQDSLVVSEQDVLVKNGLISAIAPTGQLRVEKGTPIVKGKGGYLMPGLADMHVHLPTDSLERAEFLVLQLLAGVTHVRSMRGKADQVAWCKAIESDNRLGPRMYLASQPIQKNLVLSPEEADALVRRYKETGYDAIKILSVADSVTFEWLVAASKRHRLPLCGHVSSNIGLAQTLHSNAYTSIEHLGGYFVLLRESEAVLQAGIEQTAQKGVYNCATLDFYDTYAHDLTALQQRSGLRYVPDRLADWKATYQTYTAEKDTAELRANMAQYTALRLRLVKALYEAGAPLVLSPDATGPFAVPGFSLLREMQLHERAGLPRWVVLQLATQAAAQLVGNSQLGTLAVGQWADLVLLDANPLDDLKHLHQVQGVAVYGRWHSRQALEQALQQCRR